MNTSTSAQPAKWECTFVRKHAKRKIKYPQGIILQPELTLFKKKHYKTRQKQANQILRRGCWCSSHLSRTNSKCMHHVCFQCYLCTTSDEGIGRITLQFHTLDSPGGARAALGGESCNGNLVGKQFLSVLPSTPLVAPCLSERIVSLVRAVKRAQICNASGTLAKLLHLCFRKTIFPVPNPL